MDEQHQELTSSTAASEALCCAVCMDDDPGKMLKLGGCGHAFCIDCWRGFVETNVKSSEVTGLTCMEMGCDMPVPETLIASIAKEDEQLFAKYRLRLSSSHSLLRRRG
jgi:ariadne-1